MPYDKKENRNPDDKGNRSQDRGQGPRPRPPGSGFFIWFVILGVVVFGVWALLQQAQSRRQKDITIGELYEKIDAHEVKSIEIRLNQVTGETLGAGGKGKSQKFSVKILEAEIENLSEKLRQYNENKADDARRLDFKYNPGSPLIQVLLVQILPILLIVIILWYLLARQFRSAGGAGSMLSFGKSRARLQSKEKSAITFDHVAGIDEAKEEVQELVEFLQSPGKFRRLGGRIPRGTILLGPPGCGKTLLAKAIAGEAQVPFFSISGSDFIEMFVGVGASRVRDLFGQAKESSPCIIFLDEIDAVGRRRAIDLHGASAEGAQTLNAILVEMDGFETDDNVIVIGATNRPDVLDPALLRPGRFDRQVVVSLPDMRGRKAILQVHASKYKLGSDVDLGQLARGTPAFSGADLEALLNEAALIATRLDKNAVEMADLEEARDKVRWGRQRRSLQMPEDERRTTAFHEGGHALAAKLMPEVDPLHKVSVIPQGMSLGMTMQLPKQDRLTLPRKKLVDEMCVLMAGRVAEEMFCEDITSGAQNDLDRATDIARQMVCRWGMSDRIGPISYHEMEEPRYFGDVPVRTRGWSEATAVTIDEEVTKLIHDAYERAQKLLNGRRTELESLAENLLKYEVLYSKDVDTILAGKKLVKHVANQPDPDNGPPEIGPAPDNQPPTQDDGPDKSLV